MSNKVVECIVDVYAKPESIDKVRSALLKLVECSLEEDGCLFYILCENIHDQSQFTFIETWQNEEALDNHLQSDHIQRIGYDIYNDITRPVSLKRYQTLKIESNKTNEYKNSSLCLIL